MLPADPLLQLPFGTMDTECVMTHKKSGNFSSAAAEVTRLAKVVTLEVHTSKGREAQMDWKITDCQALQTG